MTRYTSASAGLALRLLAEPIISKLELLTPAEYEAVLLIGRYGTRARAARHPGRVRSMSSIRELLYRSRKKMGIEPWKIRAWSYLLQELKMLPSTAGKTTVVRYRKIEGFNETVEQRAPEAAPGSRKGQAQ